MASFNEIQVGRLNAVLHKLLDMKEGAPAPQLAGDVVPSIILENDRPEFHFLGNSRLCGGGLYRAGQAGFYNKVALSNPAGSGVLCIVERFDVFASTNGQIDMMGVDAVSLVGSQNGYLFDTRYGGNAWSLSTFPTCQITFEETAFAGYGVNVQVYRNTANTTMTIDKPNIILGPGTGIMLENQIVANAMGVNLWWRERALEPSETR